MREDDFGFRTVAGIYVQARECTDRIDDVTERYTGTSVDWWALGVLIYEMTIGQPPFMGKTEEELFMGIMKKKVLYPPWISLEAKAIIDAFTIKDCKDRLGSGADGVADIKKHPWLMPLDWAGLEARSVTPPYIPPKGKDKTDTSNFDTEFTAEPVRRSPLIVV